MSWFSKTLGLDKHKTELTVINSIGQDIAQTVLNDNHIPIKVSDVKTAVDVASHGGSLEETIKAVAGANGVDEINGLKVIFHTLVEGAEGAASAEVIAFKKSVEAKLDAWVAQIKTL